MEILDLRHFASSDLRILVDEEIAVWRNILHWDYRSSADMVLRYADSRTLPGFAAIERGRVHGYCFFVYEGAKGVIGDLYVEDSESTRNRRHSLEIELLRHSISTLQQSPGIHRVEAQLLIHPTGHLAAPFLKEGFRCYRRIFLTLPIDHDYSAASRSLPPDIEIHRWTESDYQPAAHIITAAYRNHVDSDVNDQYRTIAGSLRFLNNIVRFPGFRTRSRPLRSPPYMCPPEPASGLCYAPGFGMTWGTFPSSARCPNIVAWASASTFSVTATRTSRRAGSRELSLTVTEENARALALYRRLGFQHLHTFDGFVWEG